MSPHQQTTAGFDMSSVLVSRAEQVQAAYESSGLAALPESVLGIKRASFPSKLLPANPDKGAGCGVMLHQRLLSVICV